MVKMQRVEDKCEVMEQEVEELVAQGKVAKLARRHKNIIHGMMLLAIAVSLIVEGFKTADGLFLALSIICEIG